MCGIAGGWLRRGVRRDSLDQALNFLRHRGPDDSGMFFADQAALGMRRLAIIDLAGGQQPAYNEEGNIALVLNGEIYNYRELREELLQSGHVFKSHSDTEVLVHGYEQWGESMLPKLRGMFAFALWDAKKNILVLVRDRFGKKPLYFAEVPGQGLIFASEIKALRCLRMDEDWTIRTQSVYDYLSLLAVPQPYTIFEEVQLLPAASIGVFERGQLVVRKYWELRYDERSNPMSYPEAQEAVRSTIRDAVRLRLRSDVPLGVFLSGGIDSTLIAYEAVQATGKSLRTFTVAVEDAQLNEAPVAQRTARALGVQNELIQLKLNPAELVEQIVPHFDQPFADASAIPSYAVAARARQYVTVVLNGDGGDEIFGGYRRYVAAALVDRFLVLRVIGKLGANRILRLASRNRRGMTGFLDRLIRGAAQTPGERYLSWTTDTLLDGEKREFWRQDPQRSTESWIESIVPRDASLFRAQQIADQAIILPGLLVKMDMATMLASVEARSPLLDHKLAELTATFPDNYFVRGGRAKAILRDAYADVLPAEVIHAKKRGFEIPLQTWLDTDLREILHDLVGARNSLVGEFLDRQFIESILSGQVLRERNRSYLLYSLLVLEIWLRSLRVQNSEPALLAVA